MAAAKGYNRGFKTVQVVEPTRDLQSKSAALVASTSTDLATILGAAVSDDAKGFELSITGAGDVHYNPSAAATTSNAIIPTQKTFYGTKAELDLMRFISTGTPTINVIVFGTK